MRTACRTESGLQARPLLIVQKEGVRVLRFEWHRCDAVLAWRRTDALIRSLTLVLGSKNLGTNWASVARWIQSEQTKAEFSGIIDP